MAYRLRRHDDGLFVAIGGDRQLGAHSQTNLLQLAGIKRRYRHRHLELRAASLGHAGQSLTTEGGDDARQRGALEAVATDFHRLPFAQLVDIQFGNLRRYLQPLDAGQAEQRLALPQLATGLHRFAAALLASQAGRRDDDTGKGRAHRTAIQLGLQRLVFHAGVGQVHFGDLAILALPLGAGRLHFPPGRLQVHALLAGLLFEIVEFVARDDPALEQLAGLAQLALGAALRQLRAAQGTTDPRHVLATLPVAQVLQGATGLEQRRLCLAHLHGDLAGVHAQQLLSFRDPLSRLHQQRLDIAGEGRRQGHHAPRFQASDQADLMHQRGRPYGDPALPFRAFRGAAGEDQPGQRRDNRQAGGERQCRPAQEGKPVSGH